MQPERYMLNGVPKK